MSEFKPAKAGNSCTPLVTDRVIHKECILELRRCPYWSKWSESSPLSLNSLIDKIDVIDDKILITHGEKASLYNLSEDVPELYASFEIGSSKLNRRAYGGTFRSADCGLIALGSDDGRCRIFTVKEGNTRSSLRELKDVSLRAENHCCCFVQSSQVLTAYDNGCLRSFDISTGDILHSVNDLHSDHIRALAISHDGQFALTGSHDRSAILLDYRLIGQPSSVVMKFHQAIDPVLDVSFNNAGRILLASGQQIQVFDVRKMDVPMFNLDAHYGTVLSIQPVTFNSGGEYLLAGGTDKMLQFYDLSKGHHVHSIRTNSVITALGSNKLNPRCIAIANGDGGIEILEDKILENNNEKLSNKIELRPFERMLRKFNVMDAMDEMLQKGISYEDFVDFVSELITRGQLEHALMGRDVDRILQLVSEALRELPGRADILISVASVAITLLNRGQIVAGEKGITNLAKIVDKEIDLQVNLLRLKGVFNAKLHCSTNTSH